MPVKVHVSVPATTANLGPGFDCLGMALDLRNHVIFEKAESGLFMEVVGEGAGRLPVDKSNLVWRAAEMLFDQVGQRPKGLFVRQNNHIPVGSGLGSSAAAVLGGLLAANALVGNPLNRDEILEMAADMEGHPDNVTPALVGGLTIAVATDSGLVIERIAPPAGQVAVVLPDYQLSTAAARRALPRQIPMVDAIFNLSRVGLLIRALERADYERLTVAMNDKLHQPYRIRLIPGMAGAFRAGRDAGASAVVLSGAGPSVVAFAPHGHDRIAMAMSQAFELQGLKSRTWILALDMEGSRTHLNASN